MFGRWDATVQFAGSGLMIEIDTQRLLEYWIARIERDLTPFIDPGTNLILESQGRTISASWEQRGAPTAATFSVSLEAGARVTVSNQQMAYSTFFASPQMSDLMGLAKMILQTEKGGIYVDTQARLSDHPTTPARSAIDVLNVTAKQRPDDATLVVMVIGEAGAGKTSVLRQLVRLQAEAYTRGKTECLYLYVNAQGRALARFNEALATELQDLRASLTYHSISTLVRLGILVPVIDGFDELLGVGGYDDAFSSLASFIEELNGLGCLLASARSTYYEQEFVSRANRVSSLGSQVWTQVPVEVLAWDEPQVNEYIRLLCSSKALPISQGSEVQSRVYEALSGPNQPLRNKPLFVSKTVDLVLEGVSLSAEADLLEVLVDFYLNRERTEKLLDRNEMPLLDARHLRHLMIDVAEEMWNQETRELDRRSIREVAEYVLVGDGVSDNAMRVVVDRMANLAFLTPSGRPGSVAFEHETFFSYFLAHRFCEHMARDAAFPTLLLSRSILPPAVAEYAVRLLAKVTPRPSIASLIRSLGEAGAKPSTRLGQVRENAGTIARTLLVEAAANFRDGLTEQIELRHLTFPGVAFPGVTLVACELDDVEFRRTDLSRTRFMNCSSANSLFIEPIVDIASTRLELAGFDWTTQLVGLRIRDGGTLTQVFDPAQIHAALIRIGAVAEGAPAQSTIREVASTERALLEKFVRAYSRSNPVCTSDDHMHNVFSHPSWGEMQDLLVRSGVVSIETRTSSGPKRREFLRRQVLAEEILAGANRSANVPESVHVFWTMFEKAFPK